VVPEIGEITVVKGEPREYGTMRRPAVSKESPVVSNGLVCFPIGGNYKISC
jgi:hypothetical protein